MNFISEMTGVIVETAMFIPSFVMSAKIVEKVSGKEFGSKDPEKEAGTKEFIETLIIGCGLDVAAGIASAKLCDKFIK